MLNIFVYGTLMRGFGNHRLISNSRYMGKFTLRSDSLVLVMTHAGFPAVVNIPPTYMVHEEELQSLGAVRGEIYSVGRQTRRDLDILEGVPTLYTRQGVQVSIDKSFYDKRRPVSDWREQYLAEQKALPADYRLSKEHIMNMPYPTKCHMYLMDPQHRLIQGARFIINGDFGNPELSDFRYDWDAMRKREEERIQQIMAREREMEEELGPVQMPRMARRVQRDNTAAFVVEQAAPPPRRRAPPIYFTAAEEADPVEFEELDIDIEEEEF